MHFPWDILGISARNATVKDVRSAYARKLRETRPEDDPEAFQRLVEARDQALNQVTYREERTAVKLSKARQAAETDDTGSGSPPQPASDPLPYPEDAAPDAAARDALAEANVEPAPTEKAPAELAAEATRQAIDALRVMFFETVTGPAISDDMLSRSLPLWRQLVDGLGKMPLGWRGLYEVQVIRLLENVLPRVPNIVGGRNEGRPKNAAFCDLVLALDQEFGWARNDRMIYRAVDQNYLANGLVYRLKGVRGDNIEKAPAPAAPVIDRSQSTFKRAMAYGPFLVVLMLLVRLGISAIESARKPDPFSNAPQLTKEQREAIARNREIHSANLTLRVIEIGNLGFYFLSPLTIRTELSGDIFAVRQNLQKRLIDRGSSDTKDAATGQDLWELATITARELQLNVNPWRHLAKAREALEAALAWEQPDEIRKKALLLHGRLSLLIASRATGAASETEAGIAMRSFMMALARTDPENDRKFFNEIQTGIAFAMLFGRDKASAADIEKMRILFDEVALSDNPGWPATMGKCTSEANAMTFRKLFNGDPRFDKMAYKITYDPTHAKQTTCPYSSVVR